MSPDVLVYRAKEAAQTANWSTLQQCLNQYLRASFSKSCETELGQKSSLAQVTFSEAQIQANQQMQSNVLDIALYALQVGDFQARWDLAKVIPDFGIEAIAPLLTLLDDATDDDDWELAWFITRILGHYPCAEAIAALGDVLRSTPQADIAAAAVDALASMGEPAIGTLSTLVSEPATRLAAVQALAQIHHPGAVECLITVAQDGDAEVRAVAIAALGHVHQPQVTEVLINALQDVTSTVRRAAVVGLSLQLEWVTESHVLSVIEPLLWDISLEVRRQAILSISRLQSPGAAQALAQALTSPYTPPLLHGDILRALVWTGTLDALQVIQTLFQGGEWNIQNRVEFFTDLAAAFELIERDDLKGIASDVLVEALSTLDQDTSRGVDYGNVKRAIAHSLGHLGQPSATPSLTALLSEADKRVQLHAANALARLDTSI